MLEKRPYYATKTAAEFHKSEAFVRLQVGPVGCGKSVDSCIEIMRRAQQQAPGSDGIRRSRWAIIRSTYPELRSTTIKTWLTWFPEELFGKIKWDSPITHHIKYGDIDLEVLFMPMDGRADYEKLMSLELTGVYINEAQFIHPLIFDGATGRVNRYPPKIWGAPITWTGIVLDTNPPSTRHWIYKLFEHNAPDNYDVFHFDPGVIVINEVPTDGTPYAISLDGTIYINNPDADYLENLPNSNYYLQQIPGKTDEQIKVVFQGEYGIIINGRPVHPEYRRRLHFATKKLEYNPNVELALGWDFGLTPACAVVQFTPRGQFVVLEEYYSDYMGLRDFVENIVLPGLNRSFPGWEKNYVSRHDPAGDTGVQTDQKTCQQILSSYKIMSVKASDTNAAMPRREGLKYHLRRLVDGEAAFLVSNQCARIDEGLLGNFQYALIKTNDTADERFHDKPLKNEFSHICEALEYIAMYYARQDSAPAFDKDKVTNIKTGAFYAR